MIPWLEEAGVVALVTAAVTVYAVVLGLLLLGIDRKLAARMQSRVGPPIRQPFRDMFKLFCKENIVPEHAVTWVFNAAPLVALASAVTVLLYIPAGSIVLPIFGESGDLILVMYLLTVPALALVAGGFASGSPYATVGAQREMVTMIAYELPLAIAIIALAWRLSAAGIADPFSLPVVAGVVSQTTIWDVVGPLGILGCLVLLLVVAWVTPAELSRVPCDTPEAETELAGGVIVEYSGRNLALLTAAQGVKSVAMASLAVALFLPWNPSWYYSFDPAMAMAVDFVFYLVKITIVLFISVSVVRVSMARFRITQIVSLYWGYFTLAGLIGLAFVVADAIIGTGVVL
jgi:formate hydrogenlyase subunit 4